MTLVHHEAIAEDRAAMAHVRAMVAANPVVLNRAVFDQMIEHTPEAQAVTYETAIVGGVSGWWVRLAGASSTAAILYLHGGAYTLGSAWAYRNFVGQIAARAGRDTFIPDYGLAPERPFPAAIEDAAQVYQGLLAQGYLGVILAGDSAGGGLALALLALATERPHDAAHPAPLGAAVMSPWTDLTLSSPSIETRASADPFLTRDALASAAAEYLGGNDARDPRVSPLYSRLSGLPPVRIDVGEDEVLLDDSRRYAKAVAHAGGSVDLHLWQGMPHVFPSSLGLLAASAIALDQIGAFLKNLG